MRAWCATACAPPPTATGPSASRAGRWPAVPRATLRTVAGSRICWQKPTAGLPSSGVAPAPSPSPDPCDRRNSRRGPACRAAVRRPRLLSDRRIDVSVRVGLAIGGWPFGPAESDRFWAFIDRAEALGFDSIWLSDRLVSTAPILEPITGLAAVAGRTRNMKFGMSVVVLPLRNPVVLAKEIATIDFLSGGRMLPAFGIGTDDEREYEAAGVAKEERAGRTDEAVALMRRLWSEEHVTHHGRYYHTSDVTIAPRPVQKTLPIWFGGRSDAAYRRVGRSGDGWLASFLTTQEFADGAAAIRKHAAAAGRSIDEDHYGVILSTTVARTAEEAQE